MVRIAARMSSTLFFWCGRNFGNLQGKSAEVPCFISLAAVVLLLAHLSLGQNSSVQMAESAPPILEAPVASTTLSQVTIPEAAVRILSRAGVPGGVITLIECSPEALFNFEIPETTLANALTLITGADSTYRWNIDSGVVNIFPIKSIPEFLQTAVKPVDFRENPESIGAITSFLLSRKETTDKLIELQLVPAMRTIIKGINTNPKKLAVTFHHSSLLEAFNILAATHGQAVWEYQEFGCKKPKEYQLSWRRD